MNAWDVSIDSTESLHTIESIEAFDTFESLLLWDTAIDATESFHSIQPIETLYTFESFLLWDATIDTTESLHTVEALDTLKIALDSTVGLLMSVRLVAILSQVAVTIGSTARESVVLTITTMSRNGVIADLLRSSIGYLMVTVRWLLSVLIAGGDSSC